MCRMKGNSNKNPAENLNTKNSDDLCAVLQKIIPDFLQYCLITSLYYSVINLLRTINAIKPMLNNSMVEGSGTLAWLRGVTVTSERRAAKPT